MKTFRSVMENRLDNEDTWWNMRFHFGQCCFMQTGERGCHGNTWWIFRLVPFFKHTLQWTRHPCTLLVVPIRIKFPANHGYRSTREIDQTKTRCGSSNLEMIMFGWLTVLLKYLIEIMNHWNTVSKSLFVCWFWSSKERIKIFFFSISVSFAWTLIFGVSTNLESSTCCPFF